MSDVEDKDEPLVTSLGESPDCADAPSLAAGLGSTLIVR